MSGEEKLTHFIARGPGCWGKAKTQKQAIALMQRAGNGRETIYEVFNVHASAAICNDGSIEWLKGEPRPVKVAEVGFSK